MFRGVKGVRLGRDHPEEKARCKEGEEHKAEEETPFKIAGKK